MSFPHNERLLSSVESGDIFGVRKLVKDSPLLLDVNVREYYPFGECVLSKAVRGGHLEIVRLLLDANADTNLYNAILITPLHLAALGNHLQIAKLLILHGANLDFYSKNDMRPIDFCHYNTEMWQLLHDAAHGKLPVILERCEVPRVPAYAIPKSIPEEPAKKSAKGKKGSAKKTKSGKKGKKKKAK